MENQVSGIITVLFCFIGYFFSWKYGINKNYKAALLLLLVCGFILRIYTASDLFLHTWDERYHALVAKNLMKHWLVPTLYDNPVIYLDNKSWISSHIWLHKQPLPLWTMACSMKIFGINEIALRLPSILLTTTGIWLTFNIAKYFFNEKAAFIAAFLYSINGLIIEMTAGRIATDHVDIFFLFFIELAIFFSVLYVQKRKLYFNILVGISIGAAILCKWLPALIVLPIWLLLVLDTQNYTWKELLSQLVLICMVSLAVFLPWQLYIYNAFPEEAAWESSFNIKHITEVLENQGGPFYYFIDKIRINYGELVYIPMIWLFWVSFRNKMRFRYSALIIWIFIPLIFFSLIMTKMQGYILFISPALFIITGGFWCFLSEKEFDVKYKWLRNLVMLLLIALPVRYGIERIKPFQKIDRSPDWVEDLKNLKNKNIQNGIMFNYSEPIDAMFYTDLTVYSDLPDIDLIRDLQSKGYKILMNNKPNIPNEILVIKGIQFVELTEKGANPMQR
jgi:4-amino-4-deoxy-L-arabinose transferase-like glycosyltransferase